MIAENKQFYCSQSEQGERPRSWFHLLQKSALKLTFWLAGTQGDAENSFIYVVLISWHSGLQNFTLSRIGRCVHGCDCDVLLISWSQNISAISRNRLTHWFTNCAVEASAAQGPLRKWLLTKLNLLFFWQTEMMGKSICDNVFHMVLLMF